MDLDLPSSGDYGLRRLFRPPFDHLPESQQLQNYHQRNFIPSHLYRMGVKLFRKEPTVRTRVIDASYWIPKNDQTSAKTNWPSLSSPLKDDFKPASAPTQYTVDEYKNWIAHRQELRKNLEQLGGCEQWLLSKSCTPVEASVLERLRAQRRESSLTQRTPSSSEVCNIPRKQFTLTHLFINEVATRQLSLGTSIHFRQLSCQGWLRFCIYNTQCMYIPVGE